ncbi:sulfate permease [Hesseltinella vesiculosa]|uniref:Sulfate permease n=1 Tax=Hesseltinella vesiculosa TaxID=101127 RepID=A0A1X2GU30_9FUNG|nr:sulfate permease [Hesseltinella vesiculosa]
MRQKQVVVDYQPERIRDSLQWFGGHLPRLAREYAVSLFPIASWIHRYNLAWLARDLIAGITVGVVVVPQSMGYAKIANLEPQYGLYTAFVGLIVYCLFATSKDISIGPTAVMSLLLGQAITHVQATYPQITGQEIAVTLSFLTGCIAMAIGLIRFGILVDFIPGPVIAGFMTGSAITISISQWPKLFGIRSVATSDPTYLVLGHFFQALPETKVDVAFGLGALVWLYGIRFLCNWLTKKYPQHRNLLFYISISRNGVAVIVGTLIAYLLNIGRDTSPIYILKTVPSGFQAMGVPDISLDTVRAVAPALPSAVLILILEHVAIAKSFGRINDYSINPNQEIVAIGFTNIWSSFFGAYPSTGSFSRTAIKARSGVKTPIAGVFSAIVVLLSLYVLTPAFYYIPDALLAAVVIHAVTDLVAGWSYLKRVVSVSLLEFLVFAVAVLVTFFTALEYGTYASVGLAIFVLLVKLARPKLYTIGRIPLTKDWLNPVQQGFHDHKPAALLQDQPQHLYIPQNDPILGYLAQPLPDGVLMFRIDGAWIYPNASYIADFVISHSKKFTRRAQSVISNGDRQWNEEFNVLRDAARAQLPMLHALIFDFGRVSRLDSSGLQALGDIQNSLRRYSGHRIDFHFVNIPDPLTRMTLLIGGYGTQGDDESTVCDIPTDASTGAHLHPQKTASTSRHPGGGHFASDQGFDHGIHSTHSGQTRVSFEAEKNAIQLDQYHYQQQQQQQHPRLSNQSSYYSHDPLNPVTDFARRVSIESLSSSAIPMPRDLYPYFHWSPDLAVQAVVTTMEKNQQLYDFSHAI